MNAEPLIWIVVPVFEREHHISNLVTNLKAQSYANYKLIIVDHGRKKIKKEFDIDAEVVIASSELWWTGAVNTGLNYIIKNKNISPVSPILVINDDVTFNKNYLLNLISDWNCDKNIIMGSVCLESGSSKILYANIVLDKLKAKFNFIYNNKHVSDLGDNILKSDILSGRGTLIPANIFMNIGLYNEKYLPHYRADYELIYRAKKYGYSVYVSPNSLVYSVIDSPYKLNNEKKLKSVYELLFNKKSARNIKDIFYFSYLSFNFIYGTYYLCINLIRGLLLTVKDMTES